jgi:hypothetical protein
MASGPVQNVNLFAPVDTSTDRTDMGVTFREIVTAIRGLNESELMGNQRELRMTRNRAGRTVIELVDRETGEILGDLTPNEILDMADELRREQRKEEDR